MSGGSDQRCRTAGKMMAFSELGEFIDMTVCDYSSGMVMCSAFSYCNSDETRYPNRG